MPTVVPLDIAKLTFMSLKEGNVNVPSDFSNILCTSSDPSVWGFVAPLSGNTLNMGIVKDGSATLNIAADCAFNDPVSGLPTTARKAKDIKVSISGGVPTFDI